MRFLASQTVAVCYLSTRAFPLIEYHVCVCLSVNVEDVGGVICVSAAQPAHLFQSKTPWTG